MFAAVGKIARLKEFRNKASVLIGQQIIGLFLKAAFSQQNFYCSIVTNYSRFRELKHFEPVYVIFLKKIYQGIEMGDSSILTKLPTL